MHTTSGAEKYRCYRRSDSATVQGAGSDRLANRYADLFASCLHASCRHWHSLFISASRLSLPTDGALAAETPTAASDLKIILSGKFLEPGQVLDGKAFALSHSVL